MIQNATAGADFLTKLSAPSSTSAAARRVQAKIEAPMSVVPFSSLVTGSAPGSPQAQRLMAQRLHLLRATSASAGMLGSD